MSRSKMAEVIASSDTSIGQLRQESVPEWDQSSTAVLIQMYKERRCLWDRNHEFYKNRRLRREALTEMATRFNCSLADVEKKLYMLRSSFRKEYRRWNHAKLVADINSASLVRKPQWFALDLLMFLKDDLTDEKLLPHLTEPFDNYRKQQQQQQQQDLTASEIQNVFYYDSESSTLTLLEPGEVSFEYNEREMKLSEMKHPIENPLKRRSTDESSLLEPSEKRLNSREPSDPRVRLMRPSSIHLQERDSFSAFGCFVAEELKNIKDSGQMHLAKLRIHQILYDATRNFLKVPIPKL